MRPGSRLWPIALLLCIWPLAVNADGGETARLISECAATDVPQASIDSCLERVRVLEETDPSPQLPTLEAALEQRASGRPAGTRATAVPAPRAVEVAPESNVAVEAQSENQSPSQAADSAGRSGAAIEDEPPVSDPPDASADDAANDPPQP